jgi:hypothetical protein
MCIGNYTIDSESVVFRMLVNVIDDNSDRFLVIVDLVAVAALTIARFF